MLLQIIALLLSIPVGFLIAHFANDELISLRKWLRAIIIVSVVLAGWFALTGNSPIALTCGFVLIVAFISYLKSFDKNWCKRRLK